MTIDALLKVGVLVAAGVAALSVWLGWSRGFADPKRRLDEEALGLPWVALAVVNYVMWGLLGRWLGPSDFGPVPMVLSAALVVVGVSASSLKRPRWALPPWYRRERLGTSAGRRTRRTKLGDDTKLHGRR